MYKKKIFAVIIVFSAFLFSSCWIYPDYKDYEVIDEVYFFKDYETMKSVIIPMINKSFTAWHWDGDEFDKKWDKYFENVPANEDDYQKLVEMKYSYAVRNDSSQIVQFKGKTTKDTISESYWITTKKNKGVIFYQN